MIEKPCAGKKPVQGDFMEVDYVRRKGKGKNVQVSGR